MAEGAKLYLKCTVGDKIAIFKPGATTPIDFIAVAGKWEVPGDIADGDMTFRIISLVPVSPSFIKFDLTLTLERKGKITNDSIAIRIAPIILPWNGDTVEKIYVTRNIPAIPNHVVIVSNSRWTQDFMELGSSPVVQDGSKKGNILIDLLHANSVNFITNLQNQDKFWQRLECNNKGNGGDIEVMQPDNANYYGKIYHGSYTMATFIKLLKDQGIQSVADGFNTKWLHVGHVDEVVSFIGEKKVFVPSPKKAFDLMHGQIIQGKGNETIRISTYNGENSNGEDIPMVSTTISLMEICVDNSVPNLFDLKDFFKDGLPQSTSSVSFYSDSQVFPKGSYLRIDDEILYVKSVVANPKTGTVTTTIQRGANAAYGGIYSVPSTNAAHDANSKVYAINRPILENISMDNSHPAGIIKRSYTQNMIGYSLVDMPVLFDKADDNGWFAATSNIVNSLVVDGKIYYPKPFNDTFDVYIKANGGTVPVDVWNNFHLYYGELHCATNPFRKLTDPKWWNHIK